MDNKVCPRCKNDLPRSEYYLKPNGNLAASWCKACMRFNSQRYYHSPKGQEHFSAYRKTDTRRESLGRYNNSPKRKATSQRYYDSGKAVAGYRARAAKDPEWKKKRNAQARALWALKHGKIERGPCVYAHLDNCRGRMEMHHDDYDKPLEVRWVCRSHHTRIGNKTLKEPRAAYTA